MELLFIIAIVVALYVRSLRYNYMPDDVVPRSGYLYDVPDTLPPLEFVRKVPPVRVRLWLILNHICNVAFIYVLWGWKAALLFAVHPVCVNMVCWLTGNYYAGTTLLVLAAYWCISTFSYYGVIPAMAFYTAALNSTITALGFPFFYLFTLNIPGITMFLPLIAYFKGDRFKKGIEVRNSFRKRDFDKIELKKFAFMTKLVGEYIIMFFLPLKMALFRLFGENVTRTKEQYDKDCSFNEHFVDMFLLCLITLVIGLKFAPMAIIWFFVMIGPHTQFKVYGQSNACNRYLYLPMIGLCILTSMLPNYIYFTLIGFYIYRTYLYIPAWKNLEALYKNNIQQYPERAMSHSDYAQHVMANLADKAVKGEKGDANRFNEALYHMQVAKSIADKDGKLFEVYLNMAYCLSLTNDFKGAYEYTVKGRKYGLQQGMSKNLYNSLADQEKRFKEMKEKQ